jgi:uncharacterized membrane protein
MRVKRRCWWGGAGLCSAAMSQERVHFDAVLQPHRSLGRTGFMLLMLALGGVSFVAGIAFLLLGAWPVFGFLGLDVLLVYVAFRLNYRSGRMTEAVRLTDRLSVRRLHPNGRVQDWSFEPYWVRVEIDDPPQHWSQLTLSSHGRRLTIGAFLTVEERQELARALTQALRQWRAPPAAT